MSDLLYRLRVREGCVIVYERYAIRRVTPDELIDGLIYVLEQIVCFRQACVTWYRVS
jgi:hypothetical protein